MTCEAVLQSEIPLMHEKIDFRYGHFGGYGISLNQHLSCLVFYFVVILAPDLIMPKVRCYFHVNASIYSITLLENQVFTPDLLVGKLSNI